MRHRALADKLSRVRALLGAGYGQGIHYISDVGVSASQAEPDPICPSPPPLCPLLPSASFSSPLASGNQDVFVFGVRDSTEPAAACISGPDLRESISKNWCEAMEDYIIDVDSAIVQSGLPSVSPLTLSAD